MSSVFRKKTYRFYASRVLLGCLPNGKLFLNALNMHTTFVTICCVIVTKVKQIRAENEICAYCMGEPTIQGSLK